MYKSDAKYEGQLLDKIPHGQGTYSTPEGFVYEGEFENGLFNGLGRYTFADGTIHEGPTIYDFLL